MSEVLDMKAALKRTKMNPVQKMTLTNRFRDRQFPAPSETDNVYEVYFGENVVQIRSAENGMNSQERAEGDDRHADDHPAVPDGPRDGRHPDRRMERERRRIETRQRSGSDCRHRGVSNARVARNGKHARRCMLSSRILSKCRQVQMGVIRCANSPGSC